MAVHQGSALLLYIISVVTSVSATADCRDLTLGTDRNNFIRYDKITASSGTAGDRARLNYTKHPSWCATGNDDNPYLQIDLGTPHIICAVATQGALQRRNWVKTFQLNSSDDGKTYYPYKENDNIQKIFYGNVDGSGIVKQILYRGIIARYLRILPIMHHGAVCMRTQIYGVKIQSGSKFNYAYHKRATQSSVSHGGVASRAVDGRRDTYYYSGSCTHTWERGYDAWWMVDLGQDVPVYEVFIVNRDSSGDRLGNFDILIGDNSTDAGRSNPICRRIGEPLPANIGTSIYCPQSMLGRFLTISFTRRYGTLNICEVEVYTEGLAIGTLNSSVVPDDRFSASSVYEITRSATKARLLGDGSWRPRDDDVNPWLQVDLGRIYYVCAVATQGDPNTDERTTKYKVKGSVDRQRWVPVRSKITTEKEVVFDGIKDNSTSIKNILPSPLAAKVVRFYPVEKNEAYALRVEIYGVVKEPVPPIPTQIGKIAMQPRLGSHVDLVCRADDGLKIKWYHNDTDITSYSTSTRRTGSMLTSTLRVNYTSADDIYDKYSCDEGERMCTSMDYICQVDYGSYRKLQSRGKVSIFFGIWFYVILFELSLN